jgi:hypothetical protein
MGISSATVEFERHVDILAGPLETAISCVCLPERVESRPTSNQSVPNGTAVFQTKHGAGTVREEK